MLSCKDVLARHSEYMDGELSAPEAEQWREHLASCDSCARYDRVLREGVSLLARRSAIDPAPEFSEHIRFRIADEERRLRTQPINPHAGTAFSLVAVLALAVSLPVMVANDARDTNAIRVNSIESVARASEIAWHGGLAMHAEPSHVTLPAPAAELRPVHNVALVDPGYSPLILEGPIAPPSFTR